MSGITSSECLTTGFDWWLGQERVESHVGRNKVLDDYVMVRDGYLEPISSPDNKDIQKTGSHFSRFRSLMGIMDGATLENDRYVGRIIHHALIFVSGGFRTECFLRAQNQVEYEELRFNGANHVLGIRTSTAVNRAMADGFLIANSGNILVEELTDLNLQANQSIFDAHKSISRWFQKNRRYARAALAEDDTAVLVARDCQLEGIKIATVTALAAVAVRGGDFTKLPILEPKSITDVAPDPIYPIQA